MRRDAYCDGCDQLWQSTESVNPNSVQKFQTIVADPYETIRTRLISFTDRPSRTPFKRILWRRPRDKSPTPKVSLRILRTPRNLDLRRLRRLWLLFLNRVLTKPLAIKSPTIHIFYAISTAILMSLCWTLLKQSDFLPPLTRRFPSLIPLTLVSGNNIIIYFITGAAHASFKTHFISQCILMNCFLYVFTTRGFCLDWILVRTCIPTATGRYEMNLYHVLFISNSKLKLKSNQLQFILCRYRSTDFSLGICHRTIK